MPENAVLLMLLLNPVTATAVMWLTFWAGFKWWRHYAETAPRWFLRTLLVLFFALDAIYNAFYGTLYFLELPRELTFSSRVSRHIHDKASATWRRHLAIWIARNFLCRVDPHHAEQSNRVYWR